MRRATLAALAAIASLFASASAETPAAAGAETPRYVSLAAVGANGRHGPGLDHRVDWIYGRVGLPLEVIGESGPWRRLRDPGGGEVWMHVRNLSARRTVYVVAETAMRRTARPGGQALATLAPGVVGAVTGCQGEWRRVAVGGRVGWVENAALWGGDCAGL